jgi:hypothetical protein
MHTPEKTIVYTVLSVRYWAVGFLKTEPNILNIRRFVSATFILRQTQNHGSAIRYICMRRTQLIHPIRILTIHSQ